MQPVDREKKDEHDFFKIVTISTALGFGVMAAFLYSIKDMRNDVSLEFSFGTIVAFFVGAAIGWGLWAVIRRFSNKAEKGKR